MKQDRRHFLKSTGAACVGVLGGWSTIQGSLAKGRGALGAASSAKGHSISSLSKLTVEALRKRAYRSVLKIESQLGSVDKPSTYAGEVGPKGIKPYDTYMVSYRSEGLRLYARLDVPPTPAPKNGYPVLVFLHGYAGIEAAPTFPFSYTTKSIYAELIDAYVSAGYVVLTPGFRGHGTVNGIPAEGLESMKVWDNGCYLSPIFYSMDVLNLLAGIRSIERLTFKPWTNGRYQSLPLDLTCVNLTGHSQGGDVALIVLAATGRGSRAGHLISAASIWSGCFAGRFTQADTYRAMEASPEAFMSGDGSWTGTAVGKDGSINPNFVFGYPSDSIETVESDKWTWQKKQWSMPHVSDALRKSYGEMYSTINSHVRDISGAKFDIEEKQGHRARVVHDPRVEAAMAKLGAFDKVEYITQPLNLHCSDQDFYSLAAWNRDLSARLSARGGKCSAFIYPKNTHSLRASEYRWFSDSNTVEGYHEMIQRDQALFTAGKPP